MAEQLRFPFGTTTEQIHRLLVEVADKKGWDRSRVCYVIDLKSCTVRDTVYAVSNGTADLPLHPDGPTAVQRLT
jgi:hypothetical protein